MIKCLLKYFGRVHYQLFIICEISVKHYILLFKIYFKRLQMRKKKSGSNLEKVHYLPFIHYLLDLSETLFVVLKIVLNGFQMIKRGFLHNFLHLHQDCFIQLMSNSKWFLLLLYRFSQRCSSPSITTSHPTRIIPPSIPHPTKITISSLVSWGWWNGRWSYQSITQV